MGSSARIEFYSATNVVVPDAPGQAGPPLRRPAARRRTRKTRRSPSPRRSTPSRAHRLPRQGRQAEPALPGDHRQAGATHHPGEELTKAEGQPGPTGKTVVGLSFSPQGTPKMGDWSRNNPRENIAIVLDKRVLSIAPLAEGRGPRRRPRASSRATSRPPTPARSPSSSTPARCPSISSSSPRRASTPPSATTRSTG